MSNVRIHPGGTSEQHSSPAGGPNAAAERRAAADRRASDDRRSADRRHGRSRLHLLRSSGEPGDRRQSSRRGQDHKPGWRSRLLEEVRQLVTLRRLRLKSFSRNAREIRHLDQMIHDRRKELKGRR